MTPESACVATDADATTQPGTPGTPTPAQANSGLWPFTVDVIGHPAPQGSKRHVGNGIMVESSGRVKPWREDVVNAVTRAVLAGMIPPQTDAVAVDVTFALRRPASAKRRPHPHTRPDLDKLLRSTLDALTTSGVILDDARVVEITARKVYAPDGAPTGATITITPAEKDPQP
jgi:Holliday junction resolvase RusA-like endonuclease